VCEATDYGETQQLSVMVELVTFPLVNVDPMTSTVVRGDKITLKCLSPDDTTHTTHTNQNFRYEWLQNGGVITHGNKYAIVERILPIGLRLVIDSVMYTDSYDCRVTNAAGAVNVTAVIYVAGTYLG
jgi:hypothetical protein